MGCGNCGSIVNGQPAGCNNNGSCATGGCNKLNTFDWLSDVPIPVDQRFDIHEISFKNGSRKEFFRNSNQVDVMTGDLVAVETDSGYDIGRISLSGELVRLQMRKKKVSADNDRKPIRKILRKARETDLDKMMEARAKEGAAMLRARQIAMDLKLDMKIGEVEFQGDKRKATFFYTADDRVDFRELIKQFAREFRVKIEMRQIGSRQEAGKIGGIGACGRELCCSTWLSDFKSVSTAAARYQNLAINQSKLSGQCGRLKCCLNFELDTYMEANKEFPRKSDVLKTESGDAFLQKTDIFNRVLYYSYKDSSRQYALPVEEVKAILEMNKAGELANSLTEIDITPEIEEKVEFVEDARVSLSMLERGTRRRRKRGGSSGRGRGSGSKGSGKGGGGKTSARSGRGSGSGKDSGGENRGRGRGSNQKNQGSGRGKGSGSKSSGQNKNQGGNNRNQRGSNQKNQSGSGGSSNKSRSRGRGRKPSGKSGGGGNRSGSGNRSGGGSGGSRGNSNSGSGKPSTEKSGG